MCEVKIPVAVQVLDSFEGRLAIQWIKTLSRTQLCTSVHSKHFQDLFGTIFVTF